MKPLIKRQTPVQRRYNDTYNPEAVLATLVEAYEYFVELYMLECSDRKIFGVRKDRQQNRTYREEIKEQHLIFFERATPRIDLLDEHGCCAIQTYPRINELVEKQYKLVQQLLELVEKQYKLVQQLLDLDQQIERAKERRDTHDKITEKERRQRVKRVDDLVKRHENLVYQFLTLGG